MIMVTRLNGVQLVVNAELIEFVEATPDTIISLTTGKKLVVKERVEEVIDLVVAYKRSIVAGPATGSGPGNGLRPKEEDQGGR